MATLSAIKRLKTKWSAKRVFSRTPTGKKSKAKAVSNFYGSPIRKGGLHKNLGIPQNKKIPLSLIEKKLNALKKKKNKTAKEVKLEKRLVFAKNSKLKWK